MNILHVAFLMFFAQSTSIQGTVLRGINDPLSKATVELRTIGDNTAVLDSTTTADDGRFSFQNVRPGRYRLSVRRQGYVRPPVSLTVTAGEPVPDIPLQMTPTGAIYGVVYNQNGEPLGNVQVQALKPSYPEGRRVLTLVQSVQTNDLGEYRLFWLTPGRYYVSALHPRTEGNPRMNLLRSFGTTMAGGPGGVFVSSASDVDPALLLDQPLDAFQPAAEGARYIPVYFPGTTNEQVASAIELRRGVEIGGINIVITPVEARHVRGVVVDGATGRPAEYGSLRLSDVLEGPASEDPQVDSTGSFDLSLLPGLYTLTANSANGTGYGTVQVGDADIENLTITTMPPFDVKGRIVIDGSSGNGVDVSKLRISFRRDPPPPATLRLSYSTPLPAGSFTVESTPGNYRVNVDPILNVNSTAVFPNASLQPTLQNAYVKSISMGELDVLNAGLHLEKPSGIPIVITLGTAPGMVEGVVANVGNETGQSAGDVSVVLLPDVRQRTDLYQTVLTNPSGEFRFEHVPPGSYRIFAWTEVDDGAWHDSEFMRNFEGRGLPIRVQEGRTEKVQLPAIRPL